MNRSCVLDASAVLSLLVKGQATSASRTFFVETKCPWRAPRLLRMEVRNALHRLERRGALAIGAADKRLRLLETEIRFADTEGAAELDDIVHRARTASLSVYDATYLETASNGGDALATRDAALIFAARAADVEVFDLR